MKRFVFLTSLPLVLFALETVNLIKDAGFEKDSDVWQTYTGRNDGRPDSAIANRHDAEKALKGGFSGSCDNRTGDYSSIYYDSAIVIQGFCCRKTVSDLDSLTLNYAVFPLSLLPARAQACWIAFYLDAGKNPYWIAGYFLVREGVTPIVFPPNKMLDFFYFPDDTSWYPLTRNIRGDLEAGGIPTNATVDSFLLMGLGAYVPPRYGQKIYWDDVRLTGYADYDVGVKEIISGDSLREGHPYTPEARIKNFGRENAEFSVIAEIWDGETQVYYDSLPWSLEGDTEDIASFAEFTPNRSSSYILTIRTVMEPDESDEDDALSKFLIYTGITEPVTHPDAITLQVRSFTDPLCVSYSIPQGQQGTLTLYDAAGRRIERMAVQGSGKVDFPSTLPSGVYFVRLESADLTITRKAVLVR